MRIDHELCGTCSPCQRLPRANPLSRRHSLGGNSSGISGNSVDGIRSAPPGAKGKVGSDLVGSIIGGQGLTLDQQAGHEHSMELVVDGVWREREGFKSQHGGVGGGTAYWLTIDPVSVQPRLNLTAAPLRRLRRPFRVAFRFAAKCHQHGLRSQTRPDDDAVLSRTTSGSFSGRIAVSTFRTVAGSILPGLK